MSYTSSESALYFVEEIMERAQVPFILLGKTAKQVRENLDEEYTDKVTVGVRRRYLTKTALSSLMMFLPKDAEVGKNKITFTQKDTPVTIKIIDKDFKVLRNPDTVWYRLTHFKVPNPFKKYWKQRNLVR